MIEFLQIALDGLMTGVVFAALALAISVIFQGTGMLNLAQGRWRCSRHTSPTRR